MEVIRIRSLDPDIGLQIQIPDTDRIRFGESMRSPSALVKLLFVWVP